METAYLFYTTDHRIEFSPHPFPEENLAKNLPPLSQVAAMENSVLKGMESKKAKRTYQ